MQIEWKTAPMPEWQADALIFFAFEKPCGYLPALKQFLGSSGKWLADSVALIDFVGKPGDVTVIYAPGGEPTPRIILAGLGPIERFETERLKFASALALRKCGELSIARPAIPLSALEGFPGANESSGNGPYPPGALLRETLVGAMGGLHQFQELKTNNSVAAKTPEALALLCPEPPEAAMREIVTLARCEVAGITLARDLTISPANRVTPSFLAKTASELAGRFGFKIEIIDLDTARSMGLGAFAAVASGSAEPPFFIILEHAPPGAENDPALVMIGKGITFDSGGIS